MTHLSIWHTFGQNAFVNFNLNKKYMSTSFKPLADRVLIEPTPVELKTASGIIIPDSAKEKPPIASNAMTRAANLKHNFGRNMAVQFMAFCLLIIKVIMDCL